MDRRLPAALAASLLIHAAVVGGPGWRLPFDADEPEPSGPLQARLAAPRQQVAAPTPRPAAPRPRKARPAPVAEAAPEPVAPASPAPEPPAAAPAGAPPVAAEVPAPPGPAPGASAPPEARAEIAWPRQGRIRFAVTRGEGEQSTELGQSVHEWSHDGAAYRLRTVTETTGLVALFRPIRIVQLSEGAIDADGLAPREFQVERNGQPAEGARFDREAGRVTLTGAGTPRREAQGAHGAQDLLSQVYQLGLLGVAARLELMIATGKNFGPYVFEAVGEERLRTPLGELRTWHVRTPAMPGEQATELWLAEDYRRLPVRIRHIDRKGDVFDQTAVEMEIEGTRLAERAD